MALRDELKDMSKESVEQALPAIGSAVIAGVLSAVWARIKQMPEKMAMRHRRRADRKAARRVRRAARKIARRARSAK